MKKLLLAFGLLLLVCLQAKSTEFFGDTHFHSDVFVDTNTALEGLTIQATSGGALTSGAVSLTYRLTATNLNGAVPLSTNLNISFTGDTNLTNAVKITWRFKGGVEAYVVEKSFDAGASFSNFVVVAPALTNFIDFGTNNFTQDIFFGDTHPQIPAPVVPWGGGTADVEAVQNQVTSNDNDIADLFSSNVVQHFQVGTNVADISNLFASNTAMFASNEVQHFQIGTNVSDIADLFTSNNTQQTEIDTLAGAQDLDTVLSLGNTASNNITLFGNLDIQTNVIVRGVQTNSGDLIVFGVMNTTNRFVMNELVIKETSGIADIGGAQDTTGDDTIVRLHAIGSGAGGVSGPAILLFGPISAGNTDGDIRIQSGDHGKIELRAENIFNEIAVIIETNFQITISNDHTLVFDNGSDLTIRSNRFEMFDGFAILTNAGTTFNAVTITNNNDLDMGGGSIINVAPASLRFTDGSKITSTGDDLVYTTSLGTPRTLQAKADTVSLPAGTWGPGDTNTALAQLTVATNANGSVDVYKFDDTLLEKAGSFYIRLPATNIVQHIFSFASNTGQVQYILRYRNGGLSGFTALTSPVFDVQGSLTDFDHHTWSTNFSAVTNDWTEFEFLRIPSNGTAGLSGDIQVPLWEGVF